MTTVRAEKRVDWIDYAKGICIVFVVLLYSTGTAESVLHAKGWIHAVGDFARAFRMPDFFLISGLFVSRVIHRRWRDYLDSKVLHFLYFYVLWLTIDFVVAEWRGLIGHEPVKSVTEYLSLYLQPHGQLWFIYLLPLFFIAAKAMHRVPLLVVAGIAIALKLADLDTGWKMIDRFGMYFVFFYAGHVFANTVFVLVEWMRQRRVIRSAYLLAWCAINGTLVMQGLIEVPIINLVMGLTGAFAVILVATMMISVRGMGWVRYLGANSLVVYVGFGVPMILLRKIVLTNSLIDNVDLASIVLTVLSILGALAMFWLTRGTALDFLFARPAWARLPSNASVRNANLSIADGVDESNIVSTTAPLTCLADNVMSKTIDPRLDAKSRENGPPDGSRLTA